MTDFGGHRAMMVDFGIDPRCVDTMSLGELSDMLDGLSRRRGKAEVPTESERADSMAEFSQFVMNDPQVMVH